MTTQVLEVTFLRFSEGEEVRLKTEDKILKNVHQRRRNRSLPYPSINGEKEVSYTRLRCEQSRHSKIRDFCTKENFHV